MSQYEYDFFISHASEDKEIFVKPLAEALKQHFSIWYDAFSLTWGDSIRKSIEYGLLKSRYGIVVISPAFVGKKWPENELDGLFSKERNNRKVILPILHNMTHSDLEAHYPMLAGRYAIPSDKGIPHIVEQAINLLSQTQRSTTSQQNNHQNQVSHIAGASQSTSSSGNNSIDEYLANLDADFNKLINGERYFRISITPTKLQKNVIDISNTDIKSLLNDVPHQRYNGWNVKPMNPVTTDILGFYSFHQEGSNIRLHTTGHFEFFTLIDLDFCWKQEVEDFNRSPRFYPYPVCEYPVSFLRLSKELLGLININSDIRVRMQYFNIKGCTLLPGHPNSFAFRDQRGKKIFQYEHYTYEIDVPVSFIPDETAYRLIRHFYLSFGHEERVVPLFDDNHQFTP
jgi:hypothetical protein